MLGAGSVFGLECVLPRGQPPGLHVRALLLRRGPHAVCGRLGCGVGPAGGEAVFADYHLLELEGVDAVLSDAFVCVTDVVVEGPEEA